MGYRLLSKYRSELMGVAILWVMFFHAFDLDLGLEALNFVRSAGFGGVDIFILLSSMGLVLSLSSRTQDYSAFMVRRARRILPAYFVVMVPYTLFLILAQGKPWSALIWNSTLLYYWVQASGGFNWYIAGAMTFYAITPACFRRLRDASHRERTTALCVLLSFLACRVLVREGYWHAMDFFYRVPVFFLGLLLGFYVLEDRKLGKKHLLFWCLWLALGMVYLAAALGVDQNQFPLPLCHLFLFSTVPMCLVLCACFDRLPLGWLRKFFRLLGEHSLEIYLLNVSLFSQTELLRKLVSFGPTNRLYYFLMFTLNILLGVLLHKLVEGIRARRPAAV